MGKPMARNLIKAGFALTVHNRGRAPVDELVAEGAKAANSPRDAAAASDVVITIVPDSPDVEHVALGPEGIVAGAKPGLIHIDMSTISPVATRRIAAREAEAGVAMLDAPVSGGTVGAQQGTLSIMVGGDEATFEKCRPILEALGKRITYLGPSGAGQTTKACNQVMTAGIYAVMSEALVLAAKAGLDPAKVVEVLAGGAARCWALEVRAPKILRRDLAPGFKASMQYKDLNIIAETARAERVPMPVTALVRELYAAMVSAGDGELDNSAVIKVLEGMAGVEVKARS
ncbi:MAG: NAD(P)-dependent oxidoreductase [Chloroflexi bacterium]|nr:NAD(P)-dependent oxidoreductase [Chloroflexota bacterium]